MHQNATDNIQDCRKQRRCPCLIQLAIVAAVQMLAACSDAIAFDQNHRLFTKELRKYVRSDGMVQYSKWKLHREGLDEYLSQLANLPEEEYKNFSRLQKRALWLNAYNALAIKLVLDHYPINGKLPAYPANSIRQIPQTWDAVESRVAGKEVTLYKIVHDRLRKARDPRTHFAVVPAAKGGALLQRRAFEARSVLDDLKKLTDEFMKKPANLSYDPQKDTITVSQIFKWFPLDFMSEVDGKIPMPPPADDDVVRDYVMQFLPAGTQALLKGKKPQINYSRYDWTLNEAQ